MALVSPEDILLLKLEWYRKGGESSEMQWLDILSVLRIKAGELDESYLDHWAMQLGVRDPLDQGRDDARL